LFAYARGVTSSRSIAALCQENVVFMALSADSAPHFTTIADFVSSLEGEIVSMFRDVLLVCDEMGLIGREMFAVDGVKMPSNASKEWSGTRADFAKKARKMERAIGYLVRRHREADRAKEDPSLGKARDRQAKTLRAAVKKVKRFLADNDDKVGPSGWVRKSNLTDNERATASCRATLGWPWSTARIKWWCTRRPLARRRSTDCSSRCWRARAETSRALPGRLMCSSR
jgi:hypothetical protein